MAQYTASSSRSAQLSQLDLVSSYFFFSFADEVKRGPLDHLVPMFTNCQIKEATQVGHHVNQLDGRSLNVYNVFNSVSDVYEYLYQHEH